MTQIIQNCKTKKHLREVGRSEAARLSGSSASPRARSGSLLTIPRASGSPRSSASAEGWW